MAELMQGVDFWETKDGIHVLRVHYTADPTKRSEEWIAHNKIGSTEADWQMEMEVDWSSVKGVPFYPEFSVALHVAKEPLIPHPEKRVIAGQDYGLTPATVYVQVTPKGQILVLYPELQSWESGILRHGNLMIQAKQTYFPNNPITYYGDPAGNQRTQTDERTCVETLRDNYGINMINGPVVFNQRDIPIRKALSTLIDGKPQLLIDPRCTHLIEALKGGYCRRQVNDVVLDELEDNKYTHIVDALGYAVSMLHHSNEDLFKRKMPKLGGM
jgi:hypothetical protein